MINRGNDASLAVIKSLCPSAICVDIEWDASYQAISGDLLS